MDLLPTEILRDIFLWAVRMTEPDLREAHIRTNSTIWNISHVSIQWMKVALDYPLLWSLIDASGRGTERVQQMLNRSQGLPLKILAAGMDYRDPRRIDCLRMALTELERIGLSKLLLLVGHQRWSP